MAVNNKNRKSAARGTKAEGSVRLGSEFITREDINARYPICEMAQETIKVGNVNDFPISKEAQQFINAIKKGIDKSSLYFLTEAFRGFSVPMQKAMVKFFVDVYSGRIDGETRLSFTGVTHVDNLLVSVLEKMDHDTKNLDYNE
jgi:hypothetical protein